MPDEVDVFRDKKLVQRNISTVAVIRHRNPMVLCQSQASDASDDESRISEAMNVLQNEQRDFLKRIHVFTMVGLKALQSFVGIGYVLARTRIVAIRGRESLPVRKLLRIVLVNKPLEHCIE